jgi:hypothetical protein
MFAAETCTRRNLTVESDIVDAFAGLTDALVAAYGLGDPARAFHYGMMLTELHALLWGGEGGVSPIITPIELSQFCFGFMRIRCLGACPLHDIIQTATERQHLFQGRTLLKSRSI